MVARLKLKEIDGRAPPGVNFSSPLLLTGRPLERGWWVCPGDSAKKCLEVQSSCLRNTLKLRGRSNASATEFLPKGRMLVKMLQDVTVDNPQPSTYGISYGDGSEIT
jgi:hypothetical protein